MTLVSALRDPATRPRAAVELALVAALVAQVPLWAVSLAAQRPAAAVDVAALRVAAPAPRASIDPFFRSVAADAPLPAHTLYAVRTGPGGGAILAGPDGMQRSVAVGESVSDGVILAAVAADHVILAHGGARSRLDFPERTPSPPPPPPPPPPSAASTPASASGGPLPPGADQAATYATALRPSSAGGQTGYVWRPGAQGGVLAAAGLRPGDVLLRINGTPFDRSERMEELAADVAAGRPVVLEYSRNGSTYSARYDPSE